MLIKINDHITNENLKDMEHTLDREIIINLDGITYLTSNEISRLLVLHTRGKIIKFVKANAYIQERIKILKIEDIIQLLPPDDE